MTVFAPNLKTGDYVQVGGTKAPAWAVVDKATGEVITYATTRKWAREFADHTKGERIAKVRTVVYEVAH